MKMNNMPSKYRGGRFVLPENIWAGRGNTKLAPQAREIYTRNQAMQRFLGCILSQEPSSPVVFYVTYMNVGQRNKAYDLWVFHFFAGEYRKQGLINVSRELADFLHLPVFKLGKVGSPTNYGAIPYHYEELENDELKEVDAYYGNADKLVKVIYGYTTLEEISRRIKRGIINEFKRLYPDKYPPENIEILIRETY